jgi:hypothetical protein
MAAAGVTPGAGRRYPGKLMRFRLCRLALAEVGRITNCPG